MPQTLARPTCQALTILLLNQANMFHYTAKAPTAGLAGVLQSLPGVNWPSPSDRVDDMQTQFSSLDIDAKAKKAYGEFFHGHIQLASILNGEYWERISRRMKVGSCCKGSHTAGSHGASHVYVFYHIRSFVFQSRLYMLSSKSSLSKSPQNASLACPIPLLVPRSTFFPSAPWLSKY